MYLGYWDKLKYNARIDPKDKVTQCGERIRCGSLAILAPHCPINAKCEGQRMRPVSRVSAQ